MDANSTFYACSLIEYIGRNRKLSREDVVSGLLVSAIIAVAMSTIAATLNALWIARGTSVLSVWWTTLSVFSGGMLGLFLVGFSLGLVSKGKYDMVHNQ